MKKSGKVFLSVLLLLVLIVVVFLGLSGYVPGLSNILGANKPRNLGIVFSDTDRISAREKSKLVYEALPETTPITQSIQRSGSRPVNNSWSSSEVTALLNNRPYRYWPVKNVQLKINNDGSAELSGILVISKIKGFAAGIGAPPIVAEMMEKYLPPDPAFYIKAKTALSENKVSEFEIQSAYMNKISIPVSTLLSLVKPNFIPSVYAEDVTSILSKYSGKKQAVIDFINERLARINGFNAKKAYFKDGKLYFDGNLSEKEAVVQ